MMQEAFGWAILGGLFAVIIWLARRSQKANRNDTWNQLDRQRRALR
jgi:hypothetical protein